MATRGKANFASDQAFFRRMAIAIAAFILFGFAQWSARGFVDFGQVPIWVHLHGLAFVGWLALFVTQNMLAERGSLALHRQLGWAGCALVAAMVVLGSFTGVKAIELHRAPPFFANGYFLALSWLGVGAFAAMFIWAIAMRRHTEWHRRLMLSATILLMEPAFGRLLPMPLLGAAGPWLEMLLQLAVFGIAFRHDLRQRGSVHPALQWGALALIGQHVAIWLLGNYAPFVAYANAIAGD